MKNKAVILDRDGVINFERHEGYTFRLEDFIILPDVLEVMKEIQSKGYLLIIISNQSGISKGLYKQADVEVLHNHLRNECIKNGINLSEIYYCIHHSDLEKCICRKPDSLFVEKAVARFNLDPSQSYFIGDKLRDTQAGEKVDVNGILIEANSPLKDILNKIQ